MNPAFAPIPIIEILGPAEQGLSRPYKCRGEDGRLYYVKGRQTDRHSLWSEWLCGHLALAFGLNLPPFRLVEIPAELLALFDAVRGGSARERALALDLLEKRLQP